MNAEITQICAPASRINELHPDLRRLVAPSACASCGTPIFFSTATIQMAKAVGLSPRLVCPDCAPRQPSVIVAFADPPDVARAKARAASEVN